MIGLRENFPERAPEDMAAVARARLVEQVFAPGGWLQGGMALEHREQQARMAAAVIEALPEPEPLLFEAGTGVGKSLAYLIPSILQAVESKRKALVSTNTISLQEQLMEKDLPLCRALFQRTTELQAYAEFKTALLVGRGNYLCGTRLAHALAHRGELFPTAEQAELERLAEWARLTRTGLRHELDPAPLGEVWDWVNADGTACNRRTCQPETCFFQRARQRLEQAHVVVINHSLLCALLNAGAGPHGEKVRGVLFPDDFLIVDEAHTLPEVATEHFGHTLSSYALDRLFKKLYHPRRRKGLLARYGRSRDIEAVERAIAASEGFFEDLRARWLTKREVVRLREEGMVQPVLLPHLQGLAQACGAAANPMEDGAARQELLDQKDRLTGAAVALKSCCDLDEEDHVYYLERGGRRGQLVTLRAAPVEVGPVLQEVLFDRGTSVVLTSATLSTGNSMENYRERSGAEGGREGIEASPFDYRSKMRIHVAEDMPAPSRQEGRLDRSWLTWMVFSCATQMAGGTLVLFTSHADLRACAEGLRADWTQLGRSLFVQGEGVGRAELTARFCEAGDGLLLGTDSFWNGVDVPGPALSQVIITRLPFENPTHPVAEARSEWARAQGRSPFHTLTLPAAVIQFRQGVGRLIRTMSDCGTVTILDSRILHKEYGRSFVEALPHGNLHRFNWETRESLFEPLEAPPESLRGGEEGESGSSR